MFPIGWLFVLQLFQITGTSQIESDLEALHKKAMALYFSEYPTSETDSLAKSYLLAIANSEDRHTALGKGELLDTYEKLGNLFLILEQDRKAIDAYWSALSMDQSPELEDSLFFSSNLFLGEAYYKINKPDSAIYFLKEAESIFDLKESKNEGSRLYNSLGVYYYETGNYSQAINYFTKAKEMVIGEGDPLKLDTYLKYAYFSFTSNIAASLVKLKRLESAKQAFQELLRLGINTDKVYLDLVELHLESGEPDKAQSYLTNINSPKIKQSIGYANKQAETHFRNRDFPKARSVLHEIIGRFELPEKEFLKGERNIKLGNTHRLLGKTYLAEQKYEQALTHFHQAILHFDPGFSDLDPLSNPTDHVMGFAAYAMFDNLTLKAKTLIGLASNDPNDPYWEVGVKTYQEAFNKVFYLNAFYDNDMARIFLGESVLPAYQDAIEYALERNATNPQSSLVEQAFLWAESSKSISLMAGQTESSLKLEWGIPMDLLEEETALNFQISNLIQTINASEDIDVNQSLQTELRDIRLQLSRLYLRFNDFPDYVTAKSNLGIKSVRELQEDLLPKNILLVSVFESRTTRHLFYADKNSLNIISTPIQTSFYDKVSHFKNAVYSANLGERFELLEQAKEIFNGFFAGMEEDLPKYEELLIIPHGIWRDFPFDLMVDRSNSYLIENYAIGYQFSAHFLATSRTTTLSKKNMLSVAPFAYPTVKSTLSHLPYSLAEVNAFPGKKLIGEAATKTAFFDLMEEYNILHLATHAQVFMDSPFQSYVAFYPDKDDHKLYLEELHYKRFENTDLIYLSACESNYGEISASEGILGISRAFAFAGCPNIITSLWKMEDITSHYLSIKFYRYLEQGESIAKALQLAKIDLLNDPKMTQFKHPTYWAQLVYIGNPLEARTTSKFYFLFIIPVTLLVIFVISRTKKSSSVMRRIYKKYHL
jgi:CHAT domain-containing protein/Tfp pilus assembly protein PilF